MARKSRRAKHPVISTPPPIAVTQSESIPSTSLEPGTPPLMTQLQIHQGPIPMASDFAAYEKVLPGSANRIMQMAEREQKAGIWLRRLDWFSQFVSMSLGKLFLYFLVFCSLYLIIKGKSAEALLTGLAPVITVLYSTFFEDKKDKDKEAPKK